MRVIVVPHDPRWTDAFAASSRQIADALGDDLLAIHHIGSTAIPGIHAKPIIDMLAVVADVARLDARSAQVEALGYEAKGEFGIAGRRYFRRDDADGIRTHQIHAFARGSPHVERHLALRDLMRAHADLARQYSDLKRRLADAFPDDIHGYMDGKDAFIKEMERRALAWYGGQGASGVA